MTRYIFNRLVAAIGVILALSILVFLMVRLIPGDPAAAFLDANNIDPSQVDAIRERLGLDQPWPVQYWAWISGVVSGDFGRSLTQPVEIGSQIALRLPVSIELSVIATILSLAIGVPAGLLAASRRGRAVDGVVRGGTFLLVSMPAFILGTLFLLINSVTTRFQVIGYQAFAVDPVKHLVSIGVPAFFLSLGMAALLARYVRNTLLDNLDLDYVRTARAKGASPGVLVRQHALRNSMIPVMTVVGSQLAALVGGTIVMERVFALPGMGTLLIQAIQTTDYPTIQACIVVIGLVYVIVNLLVDLAYPLIDPRIRLGGTRA